MSTLILSVPGHCAKGKPPGHRVPKEVKQFWVTGSGQYCSPGQDKITIHLLQDVHLSTEPWELTDASYGVGKEHSPKSMCLGCYEME